MEYRCEATSVDGFVQQVALYIRKGYLWYVAGSLPEGKDPSVIDERIIEKYGLDLSKWARTRRKRAGWANVAYLRCGRFFVLLATQGEHPFYHEEPNIRDVRRVPIKFGGYSVSFRRSTVTGKWHSSVRIAPEEYRAMKAYLMDCAPHWSSQRMAAELYSLPFEPWAPVRRQLLNMLRSVNKTRRIAGFDAVPFHALHMKRRSVRVFENATREEGGEAA